MILNNFAAIILKQKQLRPHFKIFIKQYQQQIAFIEQSLKQDAEQIKKEATCCYCIFKRMKCFRKKLSAKFQMCSPEFYRVFSEMSSIKRQEYFIELLSFIQLIGNAYDQYQERMNKSKEHDINQYKTHISTVLLEKFISKQVIKEIQNEQQSLACLDLLVVIDQIKSQKVGRLKNFKFQLIQKKNGIQQKILVNLKNYIVVSHNIETLTIVLSTVYETITPKQIKISFSIRKSDIKYQKYLRIWTEMTKIGKIQKVIRNIDLFKVFGKDHHDQDDQMRGKNSTFLKSLVNQQQRMNFFHQKFVDSQDIIRNTGNTSVRLKRLQTIRSLRYEEMKNKLIETLNFLSQKKERQNEKVRSFKNKPAISCPKQKSDAIQRALKSTQAFIPRKTTLERRLSAEELPKQLYKYVLNIENEDGKLSIMNRHHQQRKHKEGREKHDSFFIDSNQNVSNTQEKFYRVFKLSQGQVANKIQYKRNIYNKLYPQNFQFARIESLMEMINVQFKHFYLMPEEEVAKQSNNLVGDKLGKFKMNWLDKLTKTVRVYCRKQAQNYIKIFIPLAIQIRSLVQAMVNVEAFPLWHPNIKKVEIVSVISTENAIIYRMEVINPVTNKSYTLMMVMHLFRLQGKYYIIQKSIEDLEKQKNDKGIFSLFGSKKGMNTFSKINFLMMRISNTNKNGNCEVSISLDYQPIDPKMEKDARMEQMTLFVNYIFIIHFWKLSTDKKGLNKNIFNYDWMISLSSFDQQSRPIMKSPETDIFDDAKVQISRLMERNEQSGNVQSSSQLIHSSEFHDV